MFRFRCDLQFTVLMGSKLKAKISPMKRPLSRAVYFLTAYTWTHQWLENDLEYLVYQPQRSHSSENSGICLSIAIDKPVPTPGKSRRRQKEPGEEGRYYRIHKLDKNCDDTSMSQSLIGDTFLDGGLLNPVTTYRSPSHYQTTLPSVTKQKRTGEFTITLEGKYP